MDAATVVIAIVAAVIGAVVAWAVASARHARAQSDQRARVAAAEAATVAAREELAHARAELETRDDRDRRDQSVLRALAPVSETLHVMRRRVDELERERQTQYGSLAEQLRRAQESDEALRATTESLASALRSGATRGVWGETQLRRVVEAAGLTRHVDFDLQSSLSSDAGAGRPDMVVRLPGGKALALDAKVPLDAYLEASAIALTATGDDGERRRTLMTRHARAVRAHVDALAKKAYWAGLDASPEFVICFLPSESLLASALDEDPALLDYAFTRRVALASPVNLWAVLKTVAFTWTQQEVSAEARTLFDLGSQLYERLGGLAGHADSLRRALERTVDAYNGFAGSLESRVLVTARRFPGIDETKRDAVIAPAPIEKSPRRLTAPELLAAIDD
jgi:DNA recombination protein RmuC